VGINREHGLLVHVPYVEGEGTMSQAEKKYIVELEGRVQSFEVPVYAKSLDEATLKSQEYEDAGFVVGRIRPELHD